MDNMHPLPSPNSSPSPKSADLASRLGRKRQWSQSMQSDASSSSVKRSVSDDGALHSPHASHLPTLADPNDIDAYMAEQGEADIPNALVSSASGSHNATGYQSVPPAEKIALVDTSKGKTMEVGETWYLISRDWWKRWKKACTGEIDKEGPMNEQDLGPVDNSRLLDQYGNLPSPLTEGVDVEFVPEKIWFSFVAWYGEAKQPLARRVIARGNSRQVSLELYPLRLRVLRLAKGTSEVNTDGPSHPYVTISAGDTIKALCERLANVVSPDPRTYTPYRVWGITTVDENWNYAQFPSSLLASCDWKLVKESTKTVGEEGIESDDGFVVEFKQPDGWIWDPPKLQNKAFAILGRREPSAPLFNSNDGFFNRMGSGISSSSSSFKASESFQSNLLSAPSKPSTSSLPFNNRHTKSLEPGTLGLGNMGNTCFMNSALQCLAHNQELMEYFLTGVYVNELNPDNPLGMHGAIAEAFGALSQRIWADSGPSNSFSPRDFKSQLQRFAPQFSGYQQHDSQEFVAFLLDGLHEDLNRVLKKPYVEKPDWEGGGDRELVELAQKSWEGYMMRNDSVIVDLFQGQYQSTLVCPECQKVSITFDPFMYLTVPLPVQKKWKHTVYYVPWDIEKRHVKLPVEINRDASFKDLRALLGRWMGAPPDNLLTLEIFNHRFYKNLDDSLPCGDMSDNDTIVCFELPCHAQQSRTYQKKPEDPIIVPVYLCDANPPVRNTYTANRSPALFGYPTVLVIGQEQAADVDAMYEAVVARLQRWSKNARDLFTWEAGLESDMEEVPIRINGLPPIDSITEIKENGDVVTVQETTLDEGDIVDERAMAVVDDDLEMNGIATDFHPRKVGTKKDIFNLRLQVNHKDYGTAHTTYSANNRWESWDRRLDEADTNPVLLRQGDAFYCEFDENMKAYYFGDEHSRWEHALWDTWEQFVHPEYEESKKASAEKKHKGISLQDCLDEFTKEEKLGEDDLWYCPKCKKHQQATKRFDLWRVPDVLVVHLKRFSNSRTLRDKIDTFIDFPVEGLDLGPMVGERAAAKRLLDEGVAVEELNLGSLDEPLVYDLFGVDEHMGGLGGGHYRAYACNHLNNKWYHFDDSYVTPARATDAVNANAYLLFYRRRSVTPLGGKTYQKIQAARLKPPVQLGDGVMKTDVPEKQLPTPPNESTGSAIQERGLLPFDPSMRKVEPPQDPRWYLRSNGSNTASSMPSPPDDPPDFEESQSDTLIAESVDPLLLSSQRFDFPDPSNKGSPTSSNEAEIDLDSDHEEARPYSVGVWEASGDNSPDWDGLSGGIGSPSSSSISDMNPFSDANVQKSDHDTETDANLSHN